MIVNKRISIEMLYYEIIYSWDLVPKQKEDLIKKYPTIPFIKPGYVFLLLRDKT